MVEEHRLVRIEEKLDRLGEALASISRVEERILANNQRQDRHEDRLDWLETQVNVMNVHMSKSHTISRLGERLFWILVTALVAYISYKGV